MAKCDCYYQHGTKFLCYGTKEMEECSCGGNESKCNFYPEKRKPKMANKKRLIEVESAWQKAQKIFSDSALLLAIRVALDKAPTVDAVEVVHSAWKNGNCMRCGLYVGETTSRFYHYCPNCGASMRDGDGNG